MSLQAISIKTDATDKVAKTTGITKVIAKMSDSVGFTDLVVDTSVPFMEQVGVTFTSKKPVKNSSSPDGYTKHRCTLVIRKPIEVSTGIYTMDTLRIEKSSSVLATDADKTEMISLASQLVDGADTEAYWLNQQHGG